jgi:hypothetical protein
MNERIKVVWTILANRLMPLTRGIANTAGTVSRSRVFRWTWWERLSEILELLQRMILIPTALLFLVILFVYAWPNAKRRVVVLEPIAVPTHFTELGLTSEVLTRDVREKMQEIQDVSDWVPKPNITPPSGHIAHQCYPRSHDRPRFRLLSDQNQTITRIVELGSVRSPTCALALRKGGQPIAEDDEDHVQKQCAANRGRSSPRLRVRRCSVRFYARFPYPARVLPSGRAGPSEREFR